VQSTITRAILITHEIVCNGITPACAGAAFTGMHVSLPPAKPPANYRSVKAANATVCFKKSGIIFRWLYMED
jgi:hypothetical protein